jgi:hypothetical protein
VKLENPWKLNPWFESVAIAQQRARKRLPQPVYAALVAGSERGQSVTDNQAAFAETELASTQQVTSVAAPAFREETERVVPKSRPELNSCHASHSTASTVSVVEPTTGALNYS